MQRLIPLSEGGLVLTIARYVSPKGEVIHGRGVEPTVPVNPDVDEDEATQAPARDLALEKAIEVLAGELKKAA